MERKEVTVLVTGITGYLGSHVANQLLSSGYRVRGTLRSLKKENEVYAKVLPPGIDRARLELREIDLLDSQEKWKEVIKDCEYIQHIASPFTIAAVQDENELIKPAVEGTLNILKAAHAVGGVKRIIITSSISSIRDGRVSEYDVYDSSTLKRISEGHVFTEADWTDISKATPYPKSKTLAEKAAWDYVKENNPPFELATVNPGAIQGPYLLPFYGTSTELTKALMTNAYPALPHPVFFLYVDVRDVALVHIRAMEKPGVNGHRFLACPHKLTILETSKILRDEFLSQGYNPPTAKLPYVVLLILSLFSANMKFLLKTFGKSSRIDLSTTEKILEIQWRPVKDTIIDTAYSLVELGEIPKTPKYRSRSANN